MVVSFRISRTGTRYRPRPNSEPESSSAPGLNADDEVDASAQLPEIRSSTNRKRSVDVMEDDRNIAKNSDAEVSFILNIFSDGYTVVDHSESDVWHVHAKPEFLRPYDRRSESLITAIECGYLPTDFLDDIQLKYINGTVLCEVRDYREESSKSAANGSSTTYYPSVTKVSLKMSLDNVVKDIHLITDNTWGYGDLLELESRILLALQPKLYLDPTPNLDRLCREPTSFKLNLDIRGNRLKRLRQVSAPESSNPRTHENILDRFSKIEMLTARYKLNCKINKIEDDYKPTIFFPIQQLEHALINDQDYAILKDETCKMPLSMSLMGGNINICKTRILNFKQTKPPMPENGFVENSKFYTGLILSERESDGAVAMHHGDLDAIDYLPDDQLLPPLPNTHMADLLAEQFSVLMLREGYEQVSDHLKSTPITISMFQSSDGQPNTIPGDFNGWLAQILKGDPRDTIYEVAEPSIGGTSHHNMHPQSIGLSPGVSTARMHPHGVNNHSESQLQYQLLQQQKQSRDQRTTIIRPDRMGGNNFSMVGFQGLLGMGGDGRAGTRVVLGRGDDGHAGTRDVSPMIGQNPMATRQGMGQSNTNVPGGFVGQSNNFDGLQGANRWIHLGSGSCSGSSDVSMLGSGTGINRANDTNAMQMTQNRYMNQQQFQPIKQEPTSRLQDGSGLGSASSGVSMLGSGIGINSADNMNPMQMTQNRYMNQQQFHLRNQEPTSRLQDGSGSGSASSGVSMLGSGTGINRANNVNDMQRNVMARLNQNHHMNQQHLQLVKQEPTSHLQAGSGSGSGSSGVLMLGSGTGINRANDMNPTQGNVMAHLNQNRRMNQQQFQLGKQDPASHLQAGSGSGSGSSGVLMLGSSTGINRANDMNPPQGNVMARLNQNHHMNQQQFQLGKQDPASHLQAGSGSGSGSSGVLMLGSGTGINRANDMNLTQGNVMARLNQNRHLNQQQFQLGRQEPASHLQAGSGSGSGSSDVLMLGSGTGINRANDMNLTQGNVMARLNQNRHLNQQQFQLGRQEPASHLQAGSGSGSGSSGVLMLGSGTGINRAKDMNPTQGNVMAHLNQNRHMNQQQFQLVKQEPASHLQAVLFPSQQAGWPSPSTGRPHQREGPRQLTP